MKKQQLKNKLLSNKINEAFKKNPKADKVLITFGEGNSKIFWQARKNESGGFSITEVKTDKNDFELDEALPGDVTNPTYAKAIGQATEAIQSTDTAKIKLAMDNLERELKNPKLNDAQKMSLGALNGALTNLQNELAKQGPGSVKKIGQAPSFGKPPPSTTGTQMGAPPRINAGKQVAGKVVREADDTQDEKDETQKEKPSPKQKPAQAKPEVKPEEPVEAEPETPVAQDVPASDIPAEEESPASAINKAFAGKTIKSATVEIGKDKNSGMLTIMPSDKIPIRLKWKPGKAVLYFKNQPIEIK